MTRVYCPTSYGCVCLRLLHSSPKQGISMVGQTVELCLWFVCELVPSTSPPQTEAGLTQALTLM